MTANIISVSDSICEFTCQGCYYMEAVCTHPDQYPSCIDDETIFILNEPKENNSEH